MKSVKLGNKTLPIPIIQGGMGVGVSLGNLAGHVALAGGMGTISAAHPGYKLPEFTTKSLKANILGLRQEIQKARRISEGHGLVAVNIMVAINHYQEYVKTAIEEKVDAIISGAGLPIDLPQFVNSDTLIAPIVSSQKALELIIRRWQRKYQRLPDFIVIEGSKAGGHLGFKKEDLFANTVAKLEDILLDIKNYLQENQFSIPVFVAGGIYSAEDINYYLAKGASGVQMGTRFVTTVECDADDSFKQAYINAKEEDIIFVKSPTGFPGRAIANDYMKKIMQSDNLCVNHCYGCLKKCNPKDTPYCISQALINAAKGDNESLIFCGSNAYKCQEIVTCAQLIEELTGGSK